MISDIIKDKVSVFKIVKFRFFGAFINSRRKKMKNTLIYLTATRLYLLFRLV
jgi:hypothetical protein